MNRKSNTKLSLRLPPEVAKIIPWIISAKVSAKISGKSQLAEWAKREYEIAQERAREREEHERRAQERHAWYAHERRLRLEEETREREEREEEKRQWLALWYRRHPRGDYSRYSDEEEFFPHHSGGGKGFLSEWSWMQEENIPCHDMWEQAMVRYYGKYRSNQTYSKHANCWGHKHNCGRKPRKPWFKKARAQH